MRGIQSIGVILILLTLVLSVQNYGDECCLYVDASNMQETEKYGILMIDPEDLIDSDPIVIDGNDDFAAQGFPGAGTEEDPYIIEGLYINLNETPASYAIRVSNTIDHFVIQNCLLQGENYIDNGYNFTRYDGEGIFFDSVVNAQIFNNTFLYTQEGIVIYGSENLTIKENYFPGVINEYTGVMAINVGGNFFGPVCRNIDIRSNILENCDSGINCDDVMNFSISENVLVNSYGIHLYNVNQSVVVENLIEQGGGGILVHGDSNSIYGNNCTQGRGYGIYLLSSSHCVINQNICKENGIAINRGSEGGITVSGGSTNNNVTWNKLIDNIRNALDNGENNLFQYNYWSDYNGTDENGDGFGDTPYEIPGDANNVDPFPIVLISASYSELSLLIIVGLAGGVTVFITILFLKKR